MRSQPMHTKVPHPARRAPGLAVLALAVAALASLLASVPARAAGSGGGGGGPFGGGGSPIGGSEARVTLNLLSKDLDEGLALLVDCLKNPAFQDDRLSLRKDQLLQGIKQRNDESAQIEE